MKVQRHRARLSAQSILLGAVVFACLLAVPRATITSSYVNDLFIFLDGAQRISFGQIPNKDFHTALGPLSFYIPAFGYWLSGTMGGAMPVGMASITLALALPISFVLSTRLRPLLALPYGFFLLLVLAVPTNIGERITDLSFAMFYNRIGWAALGTLLIMYLPPTLASRRQEAVDAFCAAALTLVTLYTKITYGVVAVAFLGFLLTGARQHVWAAAAIGMTLLGVLVVEVFWQSTLAYVDDLVQAGQVSGSRNFADLAMTFLRHLADFILLAMLALPVLWRARKVQDLLFFGFCTIPGLFIQSQNAQP